MNDKAQAIVDALRWNGYLTEQNYTSAYLVVAALLEEGTSIRDPKPGENPPGKKVVTDKDGNVSGLQG